MKLTTKEFEIDFNEDWQPEEPTSTYCDIYIRARGFRYAFTTMVFHPERYVESLGRFKQLEFNEQPWFIDLYEAIADLLGGDRALSILSLAEEMNKSFIEQRIHQSGRKAA